MDGATPSRRISWCRANSYRLTIASSSAACAAAVSAQSLISRTDVASSDWSRRKSALAAADSSSRSSDDIGVSLGSKWDVSKESVRYADTTKPTSSPYSTSAYTVII